jgi:hypothetical protein
MKILSSWRSAILIRSFIRIGLSYAAVHRNLARSC